MLSTHALQVNLEPKPDLQHCTILRLLLAFVTSLRHGAELDTGHVHALTPRERNTLLLATCLGPAGKGKAERTGIHIDWTEALNILLSMHEGQVRLQAPVNL